MAIFVACIGAASLYHHLRFPTYPIPNDTTDGQGESTDTLMTYLNSSLKGLDHLDESRLTEALNHLRASRESRRIECSKARIHNPRWQSTDAGGRLFAEMETYDNLIKRYELKLLEEPKLRQYNNYLRHLLIAYRQKEQKAIHFFVDQEKKFPGKPLDEAKKTYLFLKFIALPIINREVAAQYRRYKQMYLLPKSLRISS